MSLSDASNTGTKPAIGDLVSPAALIEGSPWRITANAALAELIGLFPLTPTELEPLLDRGSRGWMDKLDQTRPFSRRLWMGGETSGRTQRWLHGDFTPGTTPGQWIGSFVDLTPVRQEQQHHTTMAERLTHVLDSQQAMFSLIGRDETVLYGNKAYAEHRGMTPESVQGRALLDILGDLSHGHTAGKRAELFGTGQPVRFEQPFTSYAGGDRVLDVLLWPIRDEQGETVRMATLSRDVSQRHEHVNMMRQALDNLDMLFAAGTEGILLFEDDVIADANPVACDLLGIAHADLVGRAVPRLLERLGLPPHLLSDGREGEVSLQVCLLPHEVTAQLPLCLRTSRFSDDGQTCQALLVQNMRPRVLAQKRIEHLLTDLRRQTTRAEEADRSKSVFLASASHDLRQPIHSLGLFLTTIRTLARREPAINSPDLEPIVARMRSSLEGLTELLDMLLGRSASSAQAEQAVMQTVSLQTLFDDLASEFTPQAQAKGLRLRAVPTRLYVQTDPRILRRILANLLANAVRYTERGRILLGARARGDQVELQVWDTGIGIESHQLDRIFEAFHRAETRMPANESAEGLGLSIVKRATAELGVPLDMRSIRGQGSMFSVQLPLAQQQAVDRPRAAQRPSSLKTRHLSVLLIDDDSQVLSATAPLLESWGHRVLAVRTVAEALRLWDSLSEPIDVVIGDYQLDSTREGSVLMERLRGTRGADPVPVCLITGDLSPVRSKRATSEGFHLLYKPVSASDLQAFLAQATASQA